MCILGESVALVTSQNQFNTGRGKDKHVPLPALVLVTLTTTNLSQYTVGLYREQLVQWWWCECVIVIVL